MRRTFATKQEVQEGVAKNQQAAELAERYLALYLETEQELKGEPSPTARKPFGELLAESDFTSVEKALKAKLSAEEGIQDKLAKDRYHLSNVLLLQGKGAEALPQFAAASALAPDDPTIKASYARLLYDLENYEEAAPLQQAVVSIYKHMAHADPERYDFPLARAEVELMKQLENGKRLTL